MAGPLSERHAARRAEKARIKARAIRRARSKVHSWTFDPEGYIARSAWFYETPQRCSCRGCGCQRGWEGAPIGELRQIESQRAPRRPSKKRHGPYELWWLSRWMKKWYRRRSYATLELALKNLEKARREHPNAENKFEIRTR